MIRLIILRVVAVIFGLALALLLVEGAIRVLYRSLPMSYQIALRSVHVTPFSGETLAPEPLWQTDGDYQTIVRPGAVDSLQAGATDLTFPVTSYAWWGGRVGFRSAQPESGAVDAVAIGDSFTFCFIALNDCWVTVLSDQTKLNIANMGQPVTGSVSHARLYYDYVAKPELKLKQPKLVLWQFYGNDYNDDYGLALLNQTTKTPPKPTKAAPPLPQSPLAVWLRQNSAIYLIISALLRGPDPGVQQFVDPYHVKSGSIDLWFGRTYIRDAFDMTEPRNLEGETLSHDAILKTRDMVEHNGGKFVVIIMPAKEEVYRSITEPVMGKAAVDAIAAPRLRLLDFCKMQNLICFDLLPVFQAKPDQQLYYPTDLHLNAAGNRAAAEAIAEFLQTQR